MLQLSKFWVSSLGILGIALFIFYFESLPSSSSSSLFSMDSSDSSSSPSSIYDFTVKDIKGKDVSLGEYKGKVLLIVNVASKCGLTHANYKELNLLYQNYKDQGLEILAFPCNQFAGQEPGTNDQIEESACTIFKAEFPIFDKVDVNGKNTAEVYKYLKSEKGGFLGDAIKWNFTKFLVNKDGKVVARYAPTTSPLKIEKDIQNLLGVAATASA
ncbi:Probable glutathione peroxidase 2 [Linum perenne]